MRRAATVIAWLAVLPVVAWGAVRLLGLERGYPLVPMMSFGAYVSAASILPVLLAVLLRRWLPAAVGGAIVLALAAGLAPRVLGDPPPEGEPSLRLLTLNTKFVAADAEALVALAERERIDVVALQEMTSAGEKRLRAAGFARRYPRRRVTVRGDRGGSAVYARRPFRLTALPDLDGVLLPTAVVELRRPGRLPVEVVSVHATSPRNDVGVAVWRRDLAALPDATPAAAVRVLAGDFNATLDHRALRDLVGSGYRDAAEVAGAGLEPTRTEDRTVPLPATIDHVLADERVGVGRVGVHEVPGTDHRAVVAELHLPAAGTAPDS